MRTRIRMSDATASTPNRANRGARPRVARRASHWRDGGARRRVATHAQDYRSDPVRRDRGCFRVARAHRVPSRTQRRSCTGQGVPLIQRASALRAGLRRGWRPFGAFGSLGVAPLDTVAYMREPSWSRPRKPSVGHLRWLLVEAVEGSDEPFEFARTLAFHRTCDVTLSLD